MRFGVVKNLNAKVEFSQWFHKWSSSHSWGTWRGWRKEKEIGRWGRSLHCPLPVLIFSPPVFFSCSPPRPALCSLLPAALEELPDSSPGCPTPVPFVPCVFRDLELPSGPCHCSSLAAACFPAHLPQFLPDSLSDTMPLICKSTGTPKAGLGAGRLLIISGAEGAPHQGSLSGCCTTVLTCVLPGLHGHISGTSSNSFPSVPLIKMHHFLRLYCLS